MSHQGRPDADQWVKKFTVSYSYEGVFFYHYKKDKQDVVRKSFSREGRWWPITLNPYDVEVYKPYDLQFVSYSRSLIAHTQCIPSFLLDVYFQMVSSYWSWKLKTSSESSSSLSRVSNACLRSRNITQVYSVLSILDITFLFSYIFFITVIA